MLQDLLDWITNDHARKTWIAWLNGAAGAGKSAIAQSITELCIAHGILIASFFFFRADNTRNTINPLVATLAYQIIQLIPETKDTIVNIIEHNPLIFRQSFATQLEELIIAPLRIIQLSGKFVKIVVVIDGVDECQGNENQRNLIRTFARLVSSVNSPIIVLFASRVETQIVPCFRSIEVSNILLQVPLDEKYLPDKDIRLFLDTGFADIKNTHFLAHLLDGKWPPEESVQDITEKSSGQFIYAAVVMNFVSSPRAHPSHQLDIVRGLRPSGRATPFAHLDALYRHIFSNIQDLLATTKILAYVIRGRISIISQTARFFNIPDASVHVGLSDLASVISCERDHIRFLHASLPDFLLDEARSQSYYIKCAALSTQLSIQWFTNAASGCYRGASPSRLV